MLTNVRYSALLIFTFLTSIYPQHIDKGEALYSFYIQSQNHLEGYSQALSGNEFSYHSLRDDLREALLIRCREGMNKAEWLSQIVPVDHKDKFAVLTVIAAINYTEKPGSKMAFMINGVGRFEIPFTRNYSPEVKGDEGS